MANLGAESFHLYGPPGTVNLIEAMRYFLSRRKFIMTTKDFRDTTPHSEEVFKDEFVTIYPIPLIDEEQRETFASKYPSNPLQSSVELREQDELALQHAGRPTQQASHIQTAPDSGVGVKKVFKILSRRDRTPRPEGWGQTPPKQSIIPPLRKLTHDTAPLNAVVCYAVHTADTTGKFDVTKANALGVPVKQRSELVKGRAITLADGTSIEPHQCIGPTIPGLIFLIVECPNIRILQALTNSTRFSHYQREAAEASSSDATPAHGTHYEHVACIIHITPSDIFTSRQYQAFMMRFQPDAQHIVLNKDHCARPLVFRSSSRLQILLNQVSPTLFPLQYYTDTPALALPQSSPTDAWPARLIPSQPLLRFCLAPQNLVGLDASSAIPPLNPTEIVATTIKSNPELVASLKQAHEAVAALPPRPPLDDEPVDVVFLGTGSATPSKYRNQSSTYVNIRGWGGFLFDTGEGALGQLYRHFATPEEFNDALASLKCVFISHMHADHHLGLMRVILKHQELSNEPLLIVGPALIRGWLFEYCQLEYISYIVADNYSFVFNRDVLTASANLRIKAQDDAKPEKYVSASREDVMLLLRERLGIVNLETAQVEHCMDSFGFALEHQDGWKIAFSGDTRPVFTMKEIGTGATLLIHEATFEDDLHEEARCKCHATTSEAIKMAQDMGAQFLMMTHFSQRYPKIPTFNNSSADTGVGIAFDLMRMRFSDFDVIPKLTNCLRLLFSAKPAEETDDDEPIGDINGGD